MQVQDSLEVWKAAGNADGSEALKFPRPSFRRTATGRFVHVVVTTTSRKLSPFTSRDVIWSPPVGAVMPRVCRDPPLSWKVIQYCVPQALSCSALTVARS